MRLRLLDHGGIICEVKKAAAADYDVDSGHRYQHGFGREGLQNIVVVV